MEFIRVEQKVTVNMLDIEKPLINLWPKLKRTIKQE